MLTTADLSGLIDNWKARGVQLSVEAGDIVVANSSLLTEPDRRILREYKKELVDILAVCWRCGAHRIPPSLDAQVATLKEVHLGRLGPYRWPDATWKALRQKLRPGDVLSICRTFLNIGNPGYDGVELRRDGKNIVISRREIEEQNG